MLTYLASNEKVTKVGTFEAVRHKDRDLKVLANVVDRQDPTVLKRLMFVSHELDGRGASIIQDSKTQNNCMLKKQVRRLSYGYKYTPACSNYVTNTSPSSSRSNHQVTSASSSTCEPTCQPLPSATWEER